MGPVDLIEKRRFERRPISWSGELTAAAGLRPRLPNMQRGHEFLVTCRENHSALLRGLTPAMG